MLAMHEVLGWIHSIERRKSEGMNERKKKGKRKEKKERRKKRKRRKEERKKKEKRKKRKEPSLDSQLSHVTSSIVTISDCFASGKKLWIQEYTLSSQERTSAQKFTSEFISDSVGFGEV